MKGVNLTMGKVILIIVGIFGFVILQEVLAGQDSSTWGLSGTIISYVPLAVAIGLLLTAFRGGTK
jgi:hypothetical protein